MVHGGGVYEPLVAMNEEYYRPAGEYVLVTRLSLASANANATSSGLLEQYHIAYVHLRLDTCVVIAARFVCDGDPVDEGSGVPPAAIYRALAHAVRTHAALSATIDGADTRSPYFSRLPTVDVVSAVHFLDPEARQTADLNVDSDADAEKALAALMEAQLSEPINDAPGLPLWRLTVATRGILILAWHHAIGDGQSGLAVLRTLLCALNSDIDHNNDPEADVAELQAFRAVRPPANLRLTPPAESLLSVGPTPCALVATVASLVLPHSLTHRGVWTGHRVPIPSSTNEYPRVRARLVHLPALPTARLLAAARTHGATLSGALHALALSVLAPLLPRNHDGTCAYTSIETLTAASLRPYTRTPVPPTVMRELVSIYTCRFPTSSAKGSENMENAEFPWSTAAAFTRALHRAAPRSRTKLGLLRLLFGRYALYLRGELGEPREAGLLISNLGAFRVDDGACACSDTDSEEGPKLDLKGQASSPSPTPTPAPVPRPKWRIASTAFAQNNGILGPALKLNVVGGGDGSVSVCITWHVDALDDALAEAFVVRFREGLESLGQTS